LFACLVASLLGCFFAWLVACFLSPMHQSYRDSNSVHSLMFIPCSIRRASRHSWFTLSHVDFIGHQYFRHVAQMSLGSGITLIGDLLACLLLCLLVSVFACLFAYFQCIIVIGPTRLLVQLCSPLAQTIVAVHLAMLGLTCLLLCLLVCLLVSITLDSSGQPR
jgi:hypothetical protein